MGSNKIIKYVLRHYLSLEVAKVGLQQIKTNFLILFYLKNMLKPKRLSTMISTIVYSVKVFLLAMEGAHIFTM